MLGKCSADEAEIHRICEGDAKKVIIDGLLIVECSETRFPASTAAKSTGARQQSTRLVQFVSSGPEESPATPGYMGAAHRMSVCSLVCNPFAKSLWRRYLELKHSIQDV